MRLSIFHSTSTHFCACQLYANDVRGLLQTDGSGTQSRSRTRTRTWSCLWPQSIRRCLSSCEFQMRKASSRRKVYWTRRRIACPSCCVVICTRFFYYSCFNCRLCHKRGQHRQKQVATCTRRIPITRLSPRQVDQLLRQLIECILQSFKTLSAY